MYKAEYHTLLLILAVPIVVHNSVVLYLYRKRRPLRTSTNLVLASTACSDLLTGVLLIPFLVCSAVLEGQSPHLSPLYFTSTVVSDFVTMAIVLNISLVNAERYTALCHPYSYERLVSKSLVWKAICVVWTLSFLIAIVQVSWSYPVLAGESNEDLSKVYQVYSITTLVSVFFIPTASVIYCQVRMFIVVNRFANVDSVRGLRNGTVARPQVKAILVFLAMFLNLFLFWSPLMSVRMMMDVSPDFKPKREVLEIFVLLRCFSSLFDPVICVWCKADFKAALSAVFCHTHKRRKQAFYTAANGNCQQESAF